jgi:pentatricopeptide repeat protein
MQFSNSMTMEVVPQNSSDKITQQQLFKQLVKSRPFSELILVIKSYIMSGHMDQAESLLAMVKLVHMSDFNSKEDPSLLNMLLQAYFEKDEPRKAFEHLIALSGSRNSLTFALLLKYYLKKGQLEKCKSVIREMQMSGLLLGPELWQHYLDTKAISKSEWHHLKQVTGVLLEEEEDCSLVEIPSDIIDANAIWEANEKLVSSAKIDEIHSTKVSLCS